jgi:hypothetical protein
MRLGSTLIAAVVVAGCASLPPSFSARGVEYLSKSSDPRTVDLFFIEGGVFVECEDCVIVETIEGRKRSAHFVHPEPSCSFRPIHSRGTRGGYSEEGGYAVWVGLTDQGSKQVTRCLRNSTPSHGSAEFLVVVQDQVVGTTYLHGSDLEFSHLFFHGTGLLEAVARALFVFPVQAQEI